VQVQHLYGFSIEPKEEKVEQILRPKLSKELKEFLRYVENKSKERE